MSLFLKCIQTETVVLCIIDKTWSIEALDFLYQGVLTFERRSRTENTLLAFDPKTLKRAILDRKTTATNLATKVRDAHAKIYYRLPNEGCHLCGKPNGHSVEHYTTHLRCGNEDDLETQGHLSRQNCAGCRRRFFHFMWPGNLPSSVWSPSA